MCRNDTIHRSAVDWRRLTPGEQQQFVRRIVARAHQMRAHAIYALLRRALAGLAAAIGVAWRAWRVFTERRRAMRELSALDDRSLRDIGLNRSEIEAAVDGRGPLRRPEPFVRLKRHKPTPQRSRTMTPEQKRLIKQTWSQVVPIADTAAAIFYDRLFEIDPSTRALFRMTAMTEQRKKLMQTISVALQGLDNLEALTPVVENLGRRHRGYGVTDKHHESVGAALLWTLEKGLGTAWTPQAAAAWTELYGLLSSIMRRAANEPTAHAA